MLPSNVEDLQIESTETKLPDPSMAVCTFEIDAAGLSRRIDIPTATAFVGNEGQLAIMIRHLCHKAGICFN